MKIKISKNQWEHIGNKSGWMKESYSLQPIDVDPREELKKIQAAVSKISSDFTSISSKLPRENWELIGKDCDKVVEYLDNVVGRISFIMSKAFRKNDSNGDRIDAGD